VGIKADPTTARKYLAMAGKLVGSVCLPPPPSTNNLFIEITPKGKTRTVKVSSPEYNRWKKQADSIVIALRSPSAYPCALHFCLLGKWYRQRDLSNTVKAAEDALVRCGVIHDDNIACVGELHITQERSEAPPLLRVTIGEMAPGLFGG
jgi:Holliday junction resolvase RusA-like endonuclease